MSNAGAIDRLDHDLAQMLQAVGQQLATTQRAVGQHLTELNVRLVQERKATDSDNEIVRALVDARSAVLLVTSQLRVCRLNLVRDIGDVREVLTGRIQPT